MIVSSNAKGIVSLFEELGFEVKHAPVTSTEVENVCVSRMKDANGFHVDVADSPVQERDETSIRMNVDNFEETYELLKSHGFTNTRGDGTIDLKTSRSASLISPSGFKIVIIKHIKSES